MPYDGLRVEVYPTNDYSKPIASVYTNSQGYYSISLQAGEMYDVFVRVGEPNPTQRTRETLKEGGTYTLNFNVHVEDYYTSAVTEKYGFTVVVLVALVILVVILADQLVLRKKRTLQKLERETDNLKRELGSRPAGGNELAAAINEKKQIEYMINLTKIKYHKREIDEESFREITRDYQKKLIEIEARINKLGGG
jgi:hypothetical protein